MKNKKLWLLYPLLCLLLVFGLSVPVSANGPQPVQSFYGDLTINSVDAPVGTIVIARVAGLEFEVTTETLGEYGRGLDPKLVVQGAIEDGATIDFYITSVALGLVEVKTDETALFDDGKITLQNLTISAVVAAPVAGFSASPLTGDEPLTVVFTDASENMVNSPDWSWDFGDAGTSTDQNPTHEYLQDGSYTVTLTVTTTAGTDDEVKTDYITVAETEPVASFTADPTSGEYPLEVSFTDTSTSYDGIISWAWDFSYNAGLGFNVESSIQNPPAYTYESEGTFTVALRVTEADGDFNMMVAVITVTGPTPPTVLSTLPSDTATDVAIDVVASATFDEDIQAGTNFGDITISGATGVSASIVGATLTIAHDAFAYGTPYTITIPAGAVDDLDDNPLALAKVWSFTTLVQYQLTVSSTTGGTVTSPVAATSNHDTGTVVNLVAVADSSYAFVNWSGNTATIDDVHAASTTITMDSDKTIVANFVMFSAPGNVSITEADPGVDSVTVTIEPVGEVDVTGMPAGLDPQEAYVVTPTGTGSFTLVFTDVSNASSIRVYKVVGGTWTLLEVTVIPTTTIEVTMDVADPVLVFALPPVTTVTLSAGWNLLSTPILLDADSDALEQIFDAQSLANIDISYRWDAVSQQWAVPTGYELSPLEAVYLKVSSGASATAEFTLSQELSELPSRELQRGLNLIGPAPALEEGGFPGTPLDQALSSIAEAEGSLRGYTMVVSPLHNQVGWAYGLGGEIKDLIPFKGYWVVMENADTLYGFSTTPIE